MVIELCGFHTVLVRKNYVVCNEVDQTMYKGPRSVWCCQQETPLRTDPNQAFRLWIIRYMTLILPGMTS